MRVPPDFLVIGANKSGSTSLIDYLRRHPGIFIPTMKEPHYFSNPEMWERGDAWYASLFASARPDQRVGEGSMSYAGWPNQEPPLTRDPRADVIARRPDVRLVYVVRHPVDRMFSQYRYRMRYGRTASFEEALAASPSFRPYSRYDVQIARWREVLPDPRQLLVVLTEDMAARRPEFFEAVLRHIGVDPMDLAEHGEVWSNPTGPQDRAARFLAPLRHAPVLGRIFDRIPASWRTAGRNLVIRSPLGHRWTSDMQVEPMLPATRAMLLEECLPAVEAVERELGRPLLHWRA